ncbi:MAG TPA: GtrA family protein [Ktedonobacteraceae bacterium]|nr:GtrA family protein [Ktedonobacteraceae bacterium]
MSQLDYENTQITSLSERATSIEETGQHEERISILRPVLALSVSLRRLGSRYRTLLVRLSKFVLVGGTGVLVNSLALLILFQWVHLPLVAAAVLAAELAIINNYYWNDHWTFKRTRVSLGRLARFNLVSLGGLLITTGTLWVLVNHLRCYYLLANLLGISLATTWNFAVNSWWTWGGM